MESKVLPFTIYKNQYVKLKLAILVTKYYYLWRSHLNDTRSPDVSANANRSTNYSRPATSPRAANSSASRGTTSTDWGTKTWSGFFKAFLSIGSIVIEIIFNVDILRIVIVVANWSLPYIANWPITYSFFVENRCLQTTLVAAVATCFALFPRSFASNGYTCQCSEKDCKL